MRKWEYCMLSGIETSLNRRLCMSLRFSNSDQPSQIFEIEIDRERGEDMFAARYLGNLGCEGWELVAFNRAPSMFEAVLKRPLDLSEARAPMPIN
jgi:hypothetical protein